MKFIVEHMS